MLCILIGQLDGLWKAGSLTIAVSESAECVCSKSSSSFWLKNKTELISYRSEEENGEVHPQVLGQVSNAGEACRFKVRS